MSANKTVSLPSSQSDLSRVDNHSVQAEEYEELPELTDEMLSRAVVKKGGRPVATNPRKLVSLRLPEDTLARWKSTGKGWQTRMAEALEKAL